MATKTRKRALDEKNLLYHVKPVNSLYVQLDEQRPEGITLDLEEGTWSFNGRTFPIGQTADWWNHVPPGTPYGVYDRTDMEHLRRLIEVHENLAEGGGGGLSFD